MATAASGVEGALDEGAALFRAFLRKAAAADLQEMETALAAEYAALFLNAGKRSVHPFESVYTSAGRLVMQKARDEVLAAYRQAGLAQSEEFKEPEDHIALELEFMADLCRKLSRALAEGDRLACLAFLARQREFLDTHLLIWVPAFCNDLGKASSSDFYRGIATLTAEFIQSEREAIPALIEELTPS